MRPIYPPWRPQCKRFFRRPGGRISPNQPRCDGTGELLGSYAAATEQNPKPQKQMPGKRRAGRFLSLELGASLELGVWNWEIVALAKFDCGNGLDWRICFAERNFEQNTIVNSAPRPSNEADRLRALRAYDVLDTPAEEAFD